MDFTIIGDGLVAVSPKAGTRRKRAERLRAGWVIYSKDMFAGGFPAASTSSRTVAG